MASPFARLAGVAAATHDRLMGEAFEFRPMKHSADVNAPTVIDADRPVQTAQGVWIDSAARGGAGAFHQPGVKPERAGHSTSRSSISIALSALPYRPRKGDQVMRVETAARFRIFEVLPSTPGFVRITLNGV